MFGAARFLSFLFDTILWLVLFRVGASEWCWRKEEGDKFSPRPHFLLNGFIFFSLIYWRLCGSEEIHVTCNIGFAASFATIYISSKMERNVCSLSIQGLAGRVPNDSHLHSLYQNMEVIVVTFDENLLRRDFRSYLFWYF